MKKQLIKLGIVLSILCTQAWSVDIKDFNFGPGDECAYRYMEQHKQFPVEKQNRIKQLLDEDGYYSIPPDYKHLLPFSMRYDQIVQRVNNEIKYGDLVVNLPKALSLNKGTQSIKIGYKEKTIRLTPVLVADFVNMMTDAHIKGMAKRGEQGINHQDIFEATQIEVHNLIVSKKIIPTPASLDQVLDLLKSLAPPLSKNKVVFIEKQRPKGPPDEDVAQKEDFYRELRKQNEEFLRKEQYASNQSKQLREQLALVTKERDELKAQVPRPNQPNKYYGGY